jgi:hypothetical protein
MTDVPEQRGGREEPDEQPRQPEKPRMSRRRKWLIAAGVVVLVLLVVAVPAYVGTSPGFLGTYPNMETQHAQWETSAHTSASCDDCHVGPGVVAQTAFAARMLGEFYISWVVDREPEVLDTPENAACESCHIDLRAVSASGDLLIPHRAHVDILEMECVECHDYLVHEETPEGTHTPRMVDCMDCHDGEQAKDTCEACHTAKAAPDSHAAADWLITHPDEEDPECEECHGWTEDWCAECHSRRPPSHTDDWRSIHRDRVAERRNCEACHEGEFCVDCHGEVPSLNLDSAPAEAE